MQVQKSVQSLLNRLFLSEMAVKERLRFGKTLFK